MERAAASAVKSGRGLSFAVSNPETKWKPGLKRWHMAGGPEAGPWWEGRLLQASVDLVSQWSERAGQVSVRREGAVKNIVICCDGTGAEYGRHNSNVVKLYQRVVRDSTQIAFYDPGVGTFSILGRNLGRADGNPAGPGLWRGNATEHRGRLPVPDGPLPDRGPGLPLRVQPGAFTVRALAGMLHKCGLLQRGGHNLVPYASRIYNRRGNEDIAAGFKDTYCHQCKPTSSGFGTPWVPWAGSGGGSSSTPP